MHLSLDDVDNDISALLDDNLFFFFFDNLIQ